MLKTTKNTVTITEKGRDLVKISKFGAPNLDEGEKNFLRPLVLDYSPFRTYISKGFLKGEVFANEEQLYAHYEHSDCPKRKDLIESYMRFKGHRTDREARTLLKWSEQIGIVEVDEYSRKYYLIGKSIMDRESFISKLFKIYFEIWDPRKKVALIPELRTLFCCSLKISREVFDRNLLELYETMPSKVQLRKSFK